MVTDLEEIRRLAESKAAENLHFRRHLKAHHCPDGPFRLLAKEVTRQIECKSCANCCRQTRVSLSPTDIDTLARYLAMPAAGVVSQYTTPDPEDHRLTLLRHTENGCIFLDGNLCMVYEARPPACREFPYLVGGERSLGSRMASVCKRAWFCPIVYNVLEDYKKQIGYPPPRH